jgi:hypothetical protein
LKTRTAEAQENAEDGGRISGQTIRLMEFMMSDEQTKSEQTAELDQSELAHSIIESLLEHTTVVSDLIALMAQALDPDTPKL